MKLVSPEMITKKLHYIYLLLLDNFVEVGAIKNQYIYNCQKNSLKKKTFKKVNNNWVLFVSV